MDSHLLALKNITVGLPVKIVWKKFCRPCKTMEPVVFLSKKEIKRWHIFSEKDLMKLDSDVIYVPTE